MLKKSVFVAAVLALAVGLPSGADSATRMQKTFGNWRVDCSEKEGKSPKNCSLQFALINKKDKQVVFSWTVVRKDKDSETSKVVVRTPTGVLLADGVNIGFEGVEPVKLNYFTCGPRACIAEFDLSSQWIKALSSNPKVVVSYKAANGNPLKHDIDLKQFAEGLEFYTSQLSAAAAQ